MRPPTLDDLPALVELFNLCALELIGRPEFNLNDMQSEWRTPGFNLETDVRVVETTDQKLIGYMEVWDLAEPHVRIFSWGRVHPDYRGQGIGSRLLRWSEERANQAVAKAPADAQVAVKQGVLSTDTLAKHLLTEHGYHIARHFWRMVIELESAPGPVALPAGITIRPYDPATELPVVVQAVRDSFKDHWGYVLEPFEDELKKWQSYIADNEHYDPALFLIAQDGDQIAGVSLCWKALTEDAEMGWVGTLGVLRDWRRKGVALALLQHSFAEFYRRGRKRVGLGVDAASLTGATRLYEKAGMQVTREFNQYEKILRPGVDLSTQTAG
jgi:ribosomal protein S18 acetylase RimI-like enzyme